MKETQYISSDFLTPRDAWDKLSIEEQAAMMKAAISEGILDLGAIRQKYNEFAEGGNTDDDLVDWIIREEGFIASPQDIGDGKMTLGSGLTAQKWHDQYRRNGNKWTASDNRRAVREEVASRRKWAERNIPNWDSLPSSSQKALLSYKYNYDFNRANSPKLFKALADSDLQEAARQMDATSSNPAFKKGLQDRRQREQEWFLRDVVSSQPTDIAYQPAVSTQVYNPYVQQVEATRMLPTNEPDPNSYIRTREVSPQEQRRRKFQENVEAYQRFNALMNLIDLRNNPAPSYNPIYSLFGDNSEGFAKGGKIHIKPENRGKFTALKERTGHSATWFKEHGTPAQKKMAVFALNSRHWKHGLGGNLFSGEEEGSQKMQMGLRVTNDWKPFTLDDILANAARIEQQKQAMEDRFSNDLVLSNDATSVANGRPQNRHLERKAVEGAKAYAAWEKEHPSATQWSNVLGAVPFAVAAYPLAATAGSGMAALGDTAAATSVGQGITNFLAPIATTSIAGATVPQLLDLGLTSGFGAHGLQTAIDEGGISPTTTLELLPVTRVVKPAFNETAMAIENYRYPLGRPQVPDNYLADVRKPLPNIPKTAFTEDTSTIQWTDALNSMPGDPAENLLKWLGLPKNRNINKSAAEYLVRDYRPEYQRMARMLNDNGVDLTKIDYKDMPLIFDKRMESLRNSGLDRYAIANPTGDRHFNVADFISGRERPVGEMGLEMTEDGTALITDITNYTRNSSNPVKGVQERGLNSAINISRSVGGKGVVTGREYQSAPRQYHVVQKFKDRDVVGHDGIHYNSNMVNDYERRMGLPDTYDETIISQDKDIWKGMLELARAGEKEIKALYSAPVWKLGTPTFDTPTKSILFDPRIIDRDGRMIIDWSNPDIFKSFGGYLYTRI